MATGFAASTAGATFTQEEVNTSVIQPLQATSVVLQAAKKVFKSNGVPLRIPRIDAVPATDVWRAENTQIAENDPTLGEVVLLPSSLKSVKLLHRVSNELVRHSVVGITDVLGQAFVHRLGLVFDSAFLTGAGTSNTVKGMSQMSDITTMPSIGALTVDDIHDAVGAALAQNAQPTAWFMNPRDLVGLRKLRDYNGQYLVQNDVREGSTPLLAGIPVMLSTQIAANTGTGSDESTIILADMEQVAVAIDQDLTVTLLDQTFGDYDQVAIRVTARMDIGALNPKGIVCMTGVEPITPWTPPA